MTVIQIVDYARNLLNEPLSSGRTFPEDSSSFFADTVLLNYLNREQSVVQNHLIQSFENYFVTEANISLVNGTDEYALNSSVIKILRVEWIANDINNPTEIIPISFNDKEMYTGLNIDTTAASDVSAYTIKGNNMVLRPRPQRTTASAVRYYYVKKLADLTTASDVSEIPEQWHELMAWGVYKRALIQQEGAAESIAVANGEYNRYLEDLKQWAENRQIQRPRFVKRRKTWRFR